MTTNGRDTSMSAPASTTRARTDDPVVERADPVVRGDDPVVERANPVVRTDDPVVERADPKVESKKPEVERKKPEVEHKKPEVEHNKPEVEPKKPEVEPKRGARRSTPPLEAQGPDAVALAASQSDLAKLQAIRRARVIKALALTAIALVFIVFVLQNADPVSLHILWGTVSVRLIWVIVASALLGALAGYLVGRPGKILLHGPRRRQEDPR